MESIFKNINVHYEKFRWKKFFYKQTISSYFIYRLIVPDISLTYNTAFPIISHAKGEFLFLKLQFRKRSVVELVNCIMRRKLKKQSALKFAGRFIPRSGGYNAPQLAAECFQRLLWGSYPWLFSSMGTTGLEWFFYSIYATCYEVNFSPLLIKHS